ncbi:MAG: nucleotidyltransferase domain-containing protein [Deinococcota bacterium]
MSHQVDALLTKITTWAQEQPNVVALALVGSYANGTARPDSDVDLVLVCEQPSL